jgi:ABC-type amino acid transport system permease subunit
VHDRLVTIFPGDPQDEYRRRRGLVNGIQGVLFLPAQGVWIAIAIWLGGIYWVVWGIVLAIVIGAAVRAWYRERNPSVQERPPMPSVLMMTELVALALGMLALCLGHPGNTGQRV